MDNYQYKVLVDCMTYNQGKYIEDALNGFCMQETNFPFICVVMDDASTDGEQNVINDYLDRNFGVADKESCFQEENEDYRLLLVRHKNNLNCYFAVFFLKYNHYGTKDKRPYYERWVKCSKYIAMCEGDDYWTDPNKLQKQVTFLEGHGDVSLCFHPVKILGDDIKVNLQKRVGYSSINDLCFGNYIATGSVVCRNDKRIAEYEKMKIKKSRVGDYQTFMFYALIGNLYSLENEMGVYRVHADNSWRGSRPYEKRVDYESYLYNLIHTEGMPWFPKMILRIRYSINTLFLNEHIETTENKRKSYKIQWLINNCFYKIKGTLLRVVYNGLMELINLNYRIRNL